MALVHSLPTESSPFSIYAPPPLAAQDAFMQDMPNVFVIPPEEEHDENPPWCAFDASKAAEDDIHVPTDLDVLEAVLDLHRQIDNSTPLIPRLANRPQESISPRNKRYARSRDTAIEDMEIDSWRSQDIRSRGLDAEIVEVVKVRRNEGMSDVADSRNMGLKKSRTFRSRASRALKSIKNVGRAPQKPAYAEPWPSEDNGIRTAKSMDIMDSRDVPRSSSPNLARRKSLQFSQLFAFGQSNKSLVATQAADSPSISHTCPELSSLSPTESTSSHSTQLHPSMSSTETVEDPSLSGRNSPVPTLQRKKSFRERLSILDLHRLFSSSSSSTPSSASSSSSSDLSESSTGESLGAPTTPRNEEAFSHPAQRHRFGSKDPTSPLPASSFATGHAISPSAIDDDTSHRDMSLEMKLDSLHFDSLRFDPDEF